MYEIKIQSAQNGYICTHQNGVVTVYQSFDDVLEYLLLMFEGKCKEFTGESFGRVVVERAESALTQDAADYKRARAVLQGKGIDAVEDARKLRGG